MIEANIKGLCMLFNGNIKELKHAFRNASNEFLSQRPLKPRQKALYNTTPKFSPKASEKEIKGKRRSQALCHLYKRATAF